MPNVRDLMFKSATGLHELVLRASGGRLLGRAGGMPVLVLTTTGRKSGKSRNTVLTTPVQKGGNIVIVASKGGDDRHPAWYLNLRDNPQVDVTIDGDTKPMTARITEGDEKAALWTELVATYSGYGGYQKKTDREIPVIVLQPVTDRPPE